MRIPFLYNSKTIKSSVIIVVVSLLVGWLWWALVAEGALLQTFATGQGQGKIELTVSSSAIYNDVPQPDLTWELKNLVPGTDRFFDFDDVKPGDRGFHQIGLQVEHNDAYVCLDFTNLIDLENELLESEVLAGDDTPEVGELSQFIQVFAWYDENNDGQYTPGEPVIIDQEPLTAFVALNEQTYPLADATTGTVYQEGSTNYIGLAWCLGEMTVDQDTGAISCDGSGVGNTVQTDQMFLDVSIRAIATLGRPGFTCQDTDAGRVPGQCPMGYEKIVDGYQGGLAWTAEADYAGVVLVGGPPGENNQDPDGRYKYFSPVEAGETIAREVHDISYICATDDPTVAADGGQEDAVEPPLWEPVPTTPGNGVGRAIGRLRNALNL